jgi:hypothetical protein
MCALMLQQLEAEHGDGHHDGGMDGDKIAAGIAAKEAAKVREPEVLPC